MWICLCRSIVRGVRRDIANDVAAHEWDDRGQIGGEAMETGQSACKTHAHEASAAAELEHAGASRSVRAMRSRNEDTGT